MKGQEPQYRLLEEDRPFAACIEDKHGWGMNIESMRIGELDGLIRSGSGGLCWAAAADNRALTRSICCSPISLNHTHTDAGWVK